MKEIRDIIKEYDKAKKDGKKTALATVVHIEGSSYRQPGARMLITIDGQLTGAISGGCLEGDALRKALLVMAQQKATLVTYDTSDEDDAKLGVGLGCNGIIQILIEPVDDNKAGNPIELLRKINESRQRSVVTTVFSLENKKGPQPGTCILHQQDGTSVGDITIPVLQSVLKEDAGKALASQASIIRTYKTGPENFTAFTEFVPPVVSLVVVGAGNDIMPLVSMAHILGWNTIVVDGRANYARADRFPTAQKVLVAKPPAVLSSLQIDEQTVFALMTHNYNYDLAMLKQLVSVNTPYIGLLGPKKKLDRILEELSVEGKAITDEQLSRVYGPVGFDIGAETAEEIALSIMAEIKAVLSGKRGNSLRAANSSIHEHSKQRIDEIILDNNNK